MTLNDAGLFDLVIGTDKVPAEMATRWLVEAASALADHGSGAERTTASIQADPIISRVVPGVLECGLAHITRARRVRNRQRREAVGY